jgi:drug/metabolite transporter (DMT)-like permease
VVKVGLEGLPPILFLAVRFFVAAIFILLLSRIFRFDLKPTKKELKHFIVLSVWMTIIPYAINFWGMQFVNAATGAILLCSLPLFIFPVAYLVGEKEETSLRKMVGVLFGFLGVVLIFLPKIKAGGLSSAKGELALLFSSLIFAASTVYFKKFSNEISVKRCVFYQTLFAFPLLFLLGFFMEDTSVFASHIFSFKSIMAVLYLAIFGTAISFFLYYWLIKKIGAVASAFSIFMEVVIAMLLDYVFMGVTPHILAYPAVAIIFVGVWLVMVNKRQSVNQNM